jgi:hypothetical protein
MRRPASETVDKSIMRGSPSIWLEAEGSRGFRSKRKAGSMTLECHDVIPQIIPNVIWRIEKEPRYSDARVYWIQDRGGQLPKTRILNLIE